MKRQKEQSISSFFISDSNSNNSNNSNSPPKSPSKSPTPHSYVPCPICNKPINSEFINLHIDADHLLSNESENIHKKRKIIESNNSNSSSNSSNVKVDTDINENEVGENELEIYEDVGDEASSPQNPNDLPSSSTTLDNNENENEPVTSKTFLSYFKGQIRESSVKYFCLDWGNRKCYFGEKPSWEIKYSCELNWRSERRVIVLVSTIAGLEKNVLQPEVKYKNISFLKSHLQKCIRRSKSKQAVQTALHLLKLNQDEFLRRLPIIVLEDVLFHQNFGIIVWLMIASSKGMIFDKSVISWLLGFVDSLGKCPVREVPTGIETTYRLASPIVDSLSPEKRDLIYAIQLRKSFGGMKGDMKMLNYFTKVWTERFSENQYVDDIKFPVVPIQINSVKDLEIADWEISAIDFHCSNLISKFREAKGTEVNQYSDDELKSIIWNMSSSITDKTITSYSHPIQISKKIQEYEEFWKKYEKDIYDAAWKILRERC